MNDISFKCFFLTNIFAFQYEAVKNGDEYDESDYKDNKLTDTNAGFKMLQKMGWTEGKGLGVNEEGRINPINQ